MTNADAAPVVAGVDGSESALHAVRWAAREAALRQAPLRLVHVYQVTLVRHRRQAAPPPEYEAAILDQGRHWLMVAAEAATLVAPDVPVATDLRDGHAAETLVGESRTARLVVVGSRGLGGFAALLAGSVAIALSAHGHSPVVVVRASGVDDGPVVVGVDGSPLSDAALTFAFEAAAARGVPLVAVHTWQDPYLTGVWSALPNTIDWDWLQEGETRELVERLALWREKFPQVEVRPVVERELPARALLAHAEGAQLLVVGSRGRGALAGLGLGSVSQSVVHHAECPVAIARTRPT